MKVCLSCEERFEAASWLCPRCGLIPGSIDGHLAFSPELAEANEGFRSDYFATLAPLEARHFWFRSRNRLLLWALNRYFPDAKSFLEVGCGTGFVLAGIRRARPDLELSGSEIFTRGLDFAKERLPHVELFQMDAQRIPFAGEFDVIGAFDVLEHIEGDEAVLSQMFQATKPGGGIMLSVPQHRFLWSTIDDYSFHKRRYSRRELTEKVARAGFTIVCATSFVSFLVPVMLLSRFAKTRKEPFDPQREMKIVARTNTFFEKIMDLERRLIERGLSLPVGGSLFMVARRRRNTR